jgi:hypothetical protein
MAKLRAPAIDWTELALRLSNVLSQLPPSETATTPTGFGAVRANYRTPEPSNVALSTAQKEELSHIQGKIGARLAYLLKVTKNGDRMTSPSAKKAFYDVIAGHPGSALEVVERLQQETGVQLREVDRLAIAVLSELMQIHVKGTIAPESARLLPLKVASLVDKASNKTPKASASRPRQRPPNILMQAKQKLQSTDPELTWKEILTSLEGDGLVTSWDYEQINWLDENEDACTTKASTFRNWKPKKS